MRLIGFSGRKGSGKSMFAKFLKNKYGAEVISLANPIKELCARLLGVTLEQLNDMKNSDEPLKRSIVYYDKTVWMSTIRSEVPNIPEQAVSDWVEGFLGDTGSTVRGMLQTIGTELIRKHDEEWHIRRMLETIGNSTAGIVVVDDIRFPNEREAFEKAGGKVFFVLRPDLTIPVSNHSSENSIHWYDFETSRIILNIYDAEQMRKWFADLVDHPETLGKNPIMAVHHALKPEQFGSYAWYSQTTYTAHMMRTVVIPSMLKHNGCLVVNTDSVTVMKWLKENLPYVLENQTDRYEYRLETITYWNPFLIENVKEWL